MKFHHHLEESDRLVPLHPHPLSPFGTSDWPQQDHHHFFTGKPSSKISLRHQFNSLVAHVTIQFSKHRLRTIVAGTCCSLTVMVIIFKLFSLVMPLSQINSVGPTLLISIDGFRPDYLSRNVTPTLSSLTNMSDAILAHHLRPSFPTVTFPNHYTLVTGKYPSAHVAEPIWINVERHGYASAVNMWPGSEAPFFGTQPTMWMHYHPYTPQQSVAIVAHWIDSTNSTKLVTNLPDADVDDWPLFPGYKRAQWSHAPRSLKFPYFMALYLPHVDQAGHAFGPNSSQVNDALSEIDRSLAHLFTIMRTKGIWDTTNIIILSDHGMGKAGDSPNINNDSETSSYRLSLQRALGPYHNVTIIRDRWPIVMLEPIDHHNTWAILAELKRNTDRYTVYARDDLPLSLHFGNNSRIPSIIVIPDNNLQFEDIPNEILPTGMHGYVIDDINGKGEDMRAIFMARGPAFAKAATTFNGQVPAFDNVEVYGILCRALGIQPKKHSGRGFPWM